MMADFSEYKGRINKIGNDFYIKGKHRPLLFGIDGGVPFAYITFNDEYQQIVVPLTRPDPRLLLRL